MRIGGACAYAPPFCGKWNGLKKKNRVIEYHNFTVIEQIEEIYPETKQKIVRPTLNFPLVIFKAVLVLMGVAALSYGCARLLESSFAECQCPFVLRFVLLYVFGLALSIIAFAKQIIIFFIRVYQRYGPYEIRCKCLFVPNCSEYMILAIKKHGLIKGIKKGIDRLKRCHLPNGGIDYP